MESNKVSYQVLKLHTNKDHTEIDKKIEVIDLL